MRVWKNRVKMEVGGCRQSQIRRRSELTGSKFEQASGRPLYPFWPGYLDQKAPVGKSCYKIKLEIAESHVLQAREWVFYLWFLGACLSELCLSVYLLSINHLLSLLSIITIIHLSVSPSIRLSIILFLFYVYMFCLHVCLCTVFVPGAQRSFKQSRDPNRC